MVMNIEKEVFDSPLFQTPLTGVELKMAKLDLTKSLDNDKPEEWRDVKNYEGLYQVSNKGRVKSFPRIVIDKKHGREYYKEGRMLSLCLSTGYVVVGLHKDGVSKMSSVHKLVLEAFVGPRPEGMEGCHNDGNWKNNNLENLRWDTHKGNHQDRIRHGTSNRGEKHGNALCNEEMVIEIRRLYATGNHLMKELGEIFGLTENCIRQIVKGLTWKHVEYFPKTDFGRGRDRLRRMGR